MNKTEALYALRKYVEDGMANEATAPVALQALVVLLYGDRLAKAATSPEPGHTRADPWTPSHSYHPGDRVVWSGRPRLRPITRRLRSIKATIPRQSHR